MDLMIRLKELQRRMDQVLGQPRMNDRDRARYTISARLSRLEEQVIQINDKLGECLNILKYPITIEMQNKREIDFKLEDNNKNDNNNNKTVPTCSVNVK